MKPEAANVRYFVSVGFALIVFGACFYGIVLYEYNLDDLKTGALISLMTLAAQFVFAEAVGSSVGRRAQQSFAAGAQASNTPPPDDTATGPPPPPAKG